MRATELLAWNNALELRHLQATLAFDAYEAEQRRIYGQSNEQSTHRIHDLRAAEDQAEMEERKIDQCDAQQHEAERCEALQLARFQRGE